MKKKLLRLTHQQGSLIYSLINAQEAFKFKQFSVAQDRCAMKVGTDAVMLGEWAAINHVPKSILDNKA